MGIKQIFEKLMASKGHKGLTPNEVELNSYLERERLDNVGKALHQFRIKANQEILTNNTLAQGGKGILESPNVITGSNHKLSPKVKKILSNHNLFL